MRLSATITEDKGKRYFLVYNDTDRECADIAGRGWTLPDAIDDFLEQYNRVSFYDDDTPVLLGRQDITIRRPVTICKGSFHASIVPERKI